jgi:two-component system CheB/CheR fusion protein
MNLQQIADRKILERFGPPGVLVTENLDIIQFRGRTGPYLEPSPGTATLSLLKIARPELHLELRTATHKALIDTVPATAKNVHFVDGEVRRSVTLEVSPLKEPETGSRCLLVLFVEEETPPPMAIVAAPAPDARVEELERELVGTKEYLQSAIEELETSNEELKSANEELQSSNEELQSTNEELETSKEELQSTNEELTTVNDELQNRMEDLSVSNDDMQNLLGAAESTVIIVGMDLRLRRLTYAAERLLGLSTDDLNRPVSVLKAFTGRVDFERICRQVIDRLTPVQEDFQGVDGRWYHLRVHPYRTTDHVIGGAVLSIIDIDSRRRGEGGDHSGLGAFPEAVLILDDRFKVAWANARSADLFGVPVQELLGSSLEGLGGGRLAHPELRSGLARVVNQRISFGDLFLPSRDGFPEVWASGAPLADDGRFGFRILLSFHSHQDKAPS